MLSPGHITTGEASPYLPGTQIQYAWDSTGLGLLKTCARLYQYVIIDGYVAKDESIHLRFGQEYQKTIEEYDIFKAEGDSHEAAVKASIANLYGRTYSWVVDPDTKAGRYKNRESVIQASLDHMDHYKDDPARTVILDNGKAAVELSFKFEANWAPRANEDQPYLLCGHLDRVVEFNDDLYVIDHKTTYTTIGDHYFAQYEPNNQMSLYTVASKIILNAPVKGVIIDACQLLIESPTRFVRGFTYRTEDQIGEWLEDLGYWLSIAESYATAGYWPQNDTACDKFGGCRFREVCSKSPGVREQFLKTKFHKLEEGERWNPLKAR